MPTREKRVPGRKMRKKNDFYLETTTTAPFLLNEIPQKRKQLHESKKSNTPTKKSLLEFFSDATHFLPAFWYDGLFFCVLFIWFVFSISDKLEL